MFWLLIAGNGLLFLFFWWLNSEQLKAVADENYELQQLAKWMPLIRRREIDIEELPKELHDYLERMLARYEDMTHRRDKVRYNVKAFGGLGLVLTFLGLALGFLFPVPGARAGALLPAGLALLWICQTVYYPRYQRLSVIEDL